MDRIEEVAKKNGLYNITYREQVKKELEGKGKALDKKFKAKMYVESWSKEQSTKREGLAMKLQEQIDE